VSEKPTNVPQFSNGKTYEGDSERVKGILMQDKKEGYAGKIEDIVTMQREKQDLAKLNEEQEYSEQLKQKGKERLQTLINDYFNKPN
jgi:hypothetical protein